MKQQLLLLEDVHGLGRKGDIVSAKAGYTRNWLLPKKKCIFATQQTIMTQKKLKEERETQAEKDKTESKEFAKKLESTSFEFTVNVEHGNKLYGSVTALEIAKCLTEKGYSIDKKTVFLPKPIKSLGEKKVILQLKEGIEAHITVNIVPKNV